jgi:uncharacterized membrane protein YqiK
VDIYKLLTIHTCKQKFGGFTEFMAELIDFIISILFNPFLILIVGITLTIIIMFVVIKSRYLVFPPNVYVMHIRRGKVKAASYGGAFFRYPIIDQYRLLPTTIQRLEIKASEKVISKENQEIVVRGFLVWRVENAEIAFKKIAGMGSNNRKQASSLLEINITLEQLAESVIRTTVANMTLDAILRNRGKIVDELMKEFAQVVATWGISIETIEVKDVELINQDLFKNLQAEFENVKSLEAEEIKIQTRQKIQSQHIISEKEIAKARAEADREERIIRATEDELARIRELEKEEKILEHEKSFKLAKEIQEQVVAIAEQEKLKETGVAIRKKDLQLIEQDQLIELTQQEKEKSVGIAQKQKEQHFMEQERIIETQRREKEIALMQLEQKRIIEEADYNQKEEGIRAQTELIKRTKSAEAEAEAYRVNKEAEAHANRIHIEEEATAQANAQRRKIEQEAEARAKAVKLAGDAEATKIKAVAEAKKLDMINEAEGTREKLLAEAEGLSAKVEAQNQISEIVLHQQTLAEIIKSIAEVLPQIAEKMKVGDVKWINMGAGNGQNGSSPLSIIPKNIMQLLNVMEGMGVNVPSLVDKLMNFNSIGDKNDSKGNGGNSLISKEVLDTLLVPELTTSKKIKKKPDPKNS